MSGVKGKSGIYVRTEFHRQKLANIVRPKLSDETKKKISISNIGQKRSKETREKMSKSKKGKISPMKGKKHTVESKLKNSLSQKLLYQAGKRPPLWKGGNKTNGNLEAHHIKTFSSILFENNIKSLEQAIDCAELWNINNGCTLCIDCHKKTDTYGIYKR